jgi:hypothetical protein
MHFIFTDMEWNEMGKIQNTTIVAKLHLYLHLIHPRNELLWYLQSQETIQKKAFKIKLSFNINISFVQSQSKLLAYICKLIVCSRVLREDSSAFVKR